MIRRLALITLMMFANWAHAGGKAVLEGDMGPLLNADTQIKLRRTACTEQCPNYDLTVYGDGRVVFQGYDNVAFQRVVRVQISPQKLALLLKSFREIDYFDLADKIESDPAHCANLSPDQASAVTSIRVGGFSAKINHYLGCRGTDLMDQLTAFEENIDNVVDTAKWVKHHH